MGWLCSQGPIPSAKNKRQRAAPITTTSALEEMQKPGRLPKIREKTGHAALLLNIANRTENCDETNTKLKKGYKKQVTKNFEGKKQEQMSWNNE